MQPVDRKTWAPRSIDVRCGLPACVAQGDRVLARFESLLDGSYELWTLTDTEHQQLVPQSSPKFDVEALEASGLLAHRYKIACGCGYEVLLSRRLGMDAATAYRRSYGRHWKDSTPPVPLPTLVKVWDEPEERSVYASPAAQRFATNLSHWADKSGVSWLSLTTLDRIVAMS